MTDDSGSAENSVDADLETVIQLMGRMVRTMKSSGRHAEARELLKLCEEAGLGPRHVPVLFALVLNGPVPVGVLARHMALSPATVSQLVGELQRGGFVERSPDPRDRRRMIVTLHENHRERVERFAWRRLRPLRMTLEALGPVERRHFLEGWRTMIHMMEVAALDDPDPETKAPASEDVAEPPGFQGLCPIAPSSQNRED
ncbi:MarR family winged helix-turn-helix transcriptional regulator [Actinomadura litoris]|uniref:MarR family winged helix-turn-helix transcriptional regulator n=1 Tax=Actinomadura litoris TaxID=2678616 RepID=UPI001FA7C278|nr:helix-turn-helix domain-containing protein [Actinomadura litoris]